LWEDRHGVHAFTCGTVVGGLRAAANFAELFGEAELADGYRHAATEICDAMRAHIYRPELGRFARTILPREDGGFDVDPILDASLCGIFYFGAFAPDDDTVRATMRAVAEGLRVRTHIGGIARYEGDGYMRVVDGARGDIPGNPWLICTLWLADYEIAVAQTIDDLHGVTETLRRAAERALPSGAFAEQFHPLTGAPLSVSPLTWSHAALVTTVMHYLRKLESLQACDSCHHPLFRYDRRARRRSTHISESTAELTND
ncbi:MAG: glycoside hydrolase family 15 protein, partial [Acidobacteriota bacterium]|nr:glycoside hydrolase family 15 protein [Acidobacteriota bacterium]